MNLYELSQSRIATSLALPTLYPKRGMAIHRVSSSSRVWFEFELTFELAHARSIFSIHAMLGVELPKLQLPNWYHGKLPGKCQTGALG